MPSTFPCLFAPRRWNFVIAMIFPTKTTGLSFEQSDPDDDEDDDDFVRCGETFAAAEVKLTIWAGVIVVFVVVSGETLAAVAWNLKIIRTTIPIRHFTCQSFVMCTLTWYRKSCSRHCSFLQCVFHHISRQHRFVINTLRDFDVHCICIYYSNPNTISTIAN